MLCPCKDCEKKGCGVYHDKCEEYQKFAKWRKYVTEKIKEEHEFNYNIIKRREKWKRKN